MGIRFSGNLLLAAMIGACVLLAAPVAAQAQNEDSRIVEITKQIDELLSEMQAQSEQFPGVLEAIRAEREKIEKADETIVAMIDRLKQITKRMDDDSEFRSEMEAVEKEITALIAEGEASNDDVVKQLLPNLRGKLGELQKAESLRSSTIIEAHNVVRELEDNRKRLSYFIRAGAVTRAVDHITVNVGQFAAIVRKGKQVTRSLLEASSP